MQFTKSRNILNMTPVQCRQEMIKGQWVHAGDKSAMGRYCGVSKAGTILVSWTRKPEHVKILMAHSR